MNAKERSIWGIHGGKTGDADSLFLQRSCIAVGWGELGDLANLPPDRAAFKEKLAEVYPDKKPMAVANNAGQVYRFVHEMKRGDYVVYPSKRDRQIHLAEILSDYQFDPNQEPGYPHMRRVNWLRHLPRTHFSQGALYESGSAMSLFLIKNYADEFVGAIEGGVAATSVAQDDSVAAVAEEIEETSRDFVIKRLAQETKGHPFAHFVAHVLHTMGYNTRVSPEGPDGGVDIVAHKDELGFEPPIIKVQCKSGEGSVGEPEVSSLYGKVSHVEFGLFVTLGSFTPQAIRFAKSKTNLRLISGEELVGLVFEHYEQFDSRYKGLIPLRRVYVPETLEDGEE